MELTELTRNQQLALVALIENITMTDGTVVEGEQQKIGQIAEKLGEDNYRELLNDVDERIKDEDALKQFLLEVADQKARNLIYGAAMEEVMLAPSVSHGQSELLDWLKDKWTIEIQE